MNNFIFDRNSLNFAALTNNTYGALQSYTDVVTLYATCLRYFSVGILLSILPGFTFIIFLFSLREAFYSMSSMISSTCLSIIFSEAMLFFSYFWGAFHYMLSCYVESEGIIAPSTRLLILVITLLLASASVIVGYAQCLREKSISFSGTCLLAFIIASTFTSLQTSEYLGLSIYINDSVYGSILFTLTGLHFFHVFIGVVLLFVNFWTSASVYANAGYSYIVVAQLEYFCLLYWHFVELLWLFIQFTLYSL